MRFFNMYNGTQVISVKGKKHELPVIKFDNVVLVVAGKMIKIAQIHDEAWFDSRTLPDPLKIIDILRHSKNRPDIFTFCQRDFKTEPRYDFPSELTNIAAIPITGFDFWWTKQISAKTRNMVRKSQKKGVELRLVNLDDTLIEGIVRINNEVRIRQGKLFWHYGKDSGYVKKAHSSYLERSDFVGAYYKEELIGYIKIVYMGDIAGIMQIISMIKDRDKAPNNALLSKAVETCASKGIKYLLYGGYVYGKKEHSSLLDFKKNNGFEKIEFPQYYVPLTFKGQLAIKLGLNKCWTNILPASLKYALTDLRFHYYVWRERNSKSVEKSERTEN